MYLTDVFRTFHPRAEDIFFSSAQGTNILQDRSYIVSQIKPASRRVGVALRSLGVWLYWPHWAMGTDDRLKFGGSWSTASVYDAACQIQVWYLLGEEADVSGRRVLPGRLLLGQPLKFSRDHAWVVLSAVWSAISLFLGPGHSRMLLVWVAWNCCLCWRGTREFLAIDVCSTLERGKRANGVTAWSTAWQASGA